jgi:hypothetical protein
MLIVPLQPLASQVVQVMLGGQACTIGVYSKGGSMFADITVAGAPLRTCQLCLNGVLLVRFNYLGFVGDLVFVDLQGNTDPLYTGLGTRYVLVYLAPADYVVPA